jgi:hypothetical protein
MGYATRYEVEQALANALTSGNPEGGGVIDIVDIGNTLSDTVTESEMAQYIRWADEQIDGVISSIYRVPLNRVNKGTFRLADDAVAGNQFLLLRDASRFTEGDVVVIRDEPYQEENLVVPQSQCVTPTVPAPPANLPEPPDSHRLCLWLPLSHSYGMNSARVERVRYPDPIPKISARIAASFVYDKHFAAQVEGNKSEYGRFLRTEAKQQLNLVLSGVIKLLVNDANDFVGRRYYNPALDDVTSTRGEAGQNFLSES